MVGKLADVYVPLPFTVLVEVNAAVPVQVGLLGPNTVKVIVPVGLAPPARTALSEMVPPTVTGADAVVTMVGVTLLTVEVSPADPQPLAPAALLASPL